MRAYKGSDYLPSHNWGESHLHPDHQLFIFTLSSHPGATKESWKSARALTGLLLRMPYPLASHAPRTTYTKGLSICQTNWWQGLTCREPVTDVVTSRAPLLPQRKMSNLASSELRAIYSGLWPVLAGQK